MFSDEEIAEQYSEALEVPSFVWQLAPLPKGAFSVWTPPKANRSKPLAIDCWGDKPWWFQTRPVVPLVRSRWRDRGHNIK